MSTSRPFVVDPTLTAVAIGYRNTSSMLIADQICPRINVMGEKFKWTEYPIGQAFSAPETLVGRKGQVTQVEFEGIERTESVDDVIPVGDIKEAERVRAQGRSNFDPLSVAAEGLTDLIQLRREKRVADLYQDRDNFAPNNRVILSGTDQLDDYDQSAPIEIIKEAIEKPLIYRPNTVFMGFNAWSKVRSHPHLVNAVRGNLTNKGMITREEFIELFEIQDLLIGEGYINTAAKGQNATLERVWGNHIGAIYLDTMASGDVKRPTFGFTAQYGTRISGTISTPMSGLEGAEIVRVGERLKEVLPAAELGFFIENAVSG